MGFMVFLFGKDDEGKDYTAGRFEKGAVREVREWGRRAERRIQFG
jgi:hypothetical protein